MKKLKFNYSETEEEFYGKELVHLLSAGIWLVDQIEEYRKTGTIEYCKARIKSAESMKKKLIKNNLPITVGAALNNLTDAVGIRIICDFFDDVYTIVEWLKSLPRIKIIKEKDYIAAPKPNGYRSFHLITKIISEEGKEVFVEIQIRTIALDSWASLEHQMKYKQNIKNQKLIVQELKRCADEIAATDLSMQTIRELIRESGNNLK